VQKARKAERTCPGEDFSFFDAPTTGESSRFLRKNWRITNIAARIGKSASRSNPAARLVKAFDSRIIS